MQSVNELCEKGNSLSEVGMYQEALSCFKHALEKTPETYDCKFRAQSSTCTENEPRSHGDLAPPSRMRGPR